MPRIPLLSALLDAVQPFLIALSILFVVAMMVLMNFEIGLRTVFRVSTQISDEFSGYFFAASTMFGFVPALRMGRFIRVHGLMGVVPGKVTALLWLLFALTGVVVCAVLVHATFKLVATSYMFGSVSLQSYPVPLVIPQAVLPFGFALLALAFIETGFCQAVAAWTGRDGPGPDQEIRHAMD